MEGAVGQMIALEVLPPSYFGEYTVKFGPDLHNRRPGHVLEISVKPSA